MDVGGGGVLFVLLRSVIVLVYFSFCEKIKFDWLTDWISNREKKLLFGSSSRSMPDVGRK